MEIVSSFKRKYKKHEEELVPPKYRSQDGGEEDN